MLPPGNSRCARDQACKCDTNYEPLHR
jgi:hypothetical protein